MSDSTVIEASRRALTLLMHGEVEAAEAALRPALAVHPDDPNLLYVAGNCALARGDDARAIDCYERSVAAAPTFASPLLNLGFLLRRQHRLAEARHVLRRCVTLEPSVAAWLNLVSTFVNEGEPEAGETVAREALAACPGSPEIRWNLGLLLLEQGKWREGWREYRHRFDAAILEPAVYGAQGLRPPRLSRIDDIGAGQTVICHGEQGLGDEILFAGLLAEFAADVRRRGGRLVLDPNPRLRTVFARSFAIDQVPAPDAEAAAFRAAVGSTIDWVVPIGDLAGFYRTASGDFPDRAGYLSVDRERVKRLRRSLLDRAGGQPLVGIAWTGGRPHTHDLHRQVPLAHWVPLLSQPGCFVSLEYRDRREEIEALRRETGIDLVDLREITMNPDYDDTFHLVAAIDLVVTVPTSVLHVAGAVGTPCFVVMDHRAAWRECSADGGIPWYPHTHVRFVRDATAGDWSETLRTVAETYGSWRTKTPPRPVS